EVAISTVASAAQASTTSHGRRFGTMVSWLRTSLATRFMDAFQVLQCVTTWYTRFAADTTLTRPTSRCSTPAGARCDNETPNATDVIAPPASNSAAGIQAVALLTCALD